MSDVDYDTLPTNLSPNESFQRVLERTLSRRGFLRTGVGLGDAAFLAGHELLRTQADPAGTSVLGTLNNCANGFTPWGTCLSWEENLNGYFGTAARGDVRDEAM